MKYMVFGEQLGVRTFDADSFEVTELGVLLTLGGRPVAFLMADAWSTIWEADEDGTQGRPLK